MALRASLSGPVLSAGERVPEAFVERRARMKKKKLRKKKSVGACSRLRRGRQERRARPSAASGPSRVRRPSRPAGPASINLAIGASGTADTPVIGPKPDLGGAARGDRERPPALLARGRCCTPRVRAAPRSFADRPAARPRRRRPKERRRVVRHRRSARRDTPSSVGARSEEKWPPDGRAGPGETETTRAYFFLSLARRSHLA